MTKGKIGKTEGSHDSIGKKSNQEKHWKPGQVPSSWTSPGWSSAGQAPIPQEIQSEWVQTKLGVDKRHRWSTTKSSEGRLKRPLSWLLKINSKLGDYTHWEHLWCTQWTEHKDEATTEETRENHEIGFILKSQVNYPKKLTQTSGLVGDGYLLGPHTHGNACWATWQVSSWVVLRVG
jgi:hypothetical protein